MQDDVHNPLAIRAEIEREARRLSELDAERAEVRARLESLQYKLDDALAAGESATDTAAGISPVNVPVTSSAKVTLFCELFRGRRDLFPLKFVSRKTGQAGYAPECANKFVPGICALPRVKCGQCRNQAFLPVDQRAVLGHLQGRHIMGVYPLLVDETCWFLAVDFDKAAWREDVSAFAEVSRAMDVPCAVERSQSGNGAHAWFFFRSPVTAAVARQLGCHLLTETMSRRHQLGMESMIGSFRARIRCPAAVSAI